MPAQLIDVLLCDRMGISYTELYADEMPNMAVQDFELVMAEEALAIERAKKK